MGGQGSGRHPDPVKQVLGKNLSVGDFSQTESISFTNLAGVKREAKETSSVDLSGDLYILKDGTRNYTGSQSFGGFNIVNPASILDSNSNELIKFTTTSSAINEFTLANAATGSGPTLSATGSDTNIDLNFSVKGTGTYVINAAKQKWAGAGMTIRNVLDQDVIIGSATELTIDTVDVVVKKQIDIWDQINIRPFNETISSATNFILWGGYTTICNVSSSTPRFVSMTQTIEYQTTPGFFVPPFLMFGLPVITATTSSQGMGSPVMYANFPVIKADGIAWTLIDAYGGFFSAPSFSVANSGSFAAGSAYSNFTVLNTVSSGTIATIYGFKMSDTAVSGTLTTQIGLKIANLTTATNNWSIQAGSAQSYHVGNLRLGDTTAPTTLLDIIGKMTITSAGLITKYNNVATIGNGVPSLVAVSNLTGQTAAIGATTIYAVPSTGAGLYRVSFLATITTAATTSSTLGGTTGAQVRFTDPNDSVVKTTTAINANAQISQANTTATAVSIVLLAYCKASTNLQYLYGYTSSGATPMAYDLNIIVEYLG